MNKQERRFRHGELITEAWNPSIKTVPYAMLTIGEEPIPLVAHKVSAKMSEVLGETLATRARIFSAGDLRIIASVDNTLKHGRMLHISVSKQSELPTWTEMIAVKRHFFPADVAAVMAMPEEAVYVNIQEYTLHIWQLPEKWGME